MEKKQRKMNRHRHLQDLMGNIPKSIAIWAVVVYSLSVAVIVSIIKYILLS